MARKLRILQILRAPVGGLFRHVRDLTEGLAARGHEIAVLADSQSSDALTEPRLAELGQFAKLGIYRASIPRVLGPGDVSTPIIARRLCKKLSIEVVHGHGAKGGFSARLARAGRRHSVALYTPPGGVLHYKSDSLNGRIFDTLERAVLPLTAAIIFESEFALSAFEDRFGPPKCPHPVIHNGLNASDFQRVAVSSDVKDFAFVGELRELKGITYLLEALKGVQGPDGRPATLVIAGDGPLRAELEMTAAQGELGQRVVFRGVKPAREVFAEGRCVVVPSLAESLPYVVLEATAARRPVIATKVGGVAEIFGPTAHKLIPSADVTSLRRELQGFMDHPEAAEAEMTERFKFVSQHFTTAGMCDSIESLYFESLDQAEATTSS